MEGRGKKILFGCLGGCGAIVVIFVGSCVGFTMWLNSPGEVLEPEQLLGPETTGYIEWKLRMEDPGTAEFTEAMLRSFTSISQQANSPLPDVLENIINAQQTKSARRDMERLFPVVVAWTARPGDASDEDLHLFSVSAAGANHQLVLADWIFGFVVGRAERSIEVVRHRREKIYLLERTGGIQPVAFVRNGIIFVSTDVGSAQATLDRLDAPPEQSVAGAELKALFDALPAGQALRGAVTNRRGEVARILDHFGLTAEQASAEAWSDVRGLTINANFRDQDVFAGALEVHGPDAAWAETAAASMGEALAGLFADWEVKFDTEVAAVDRRVRVEFAAERLLERVKELN